MKDPEIQLRVLAFAQVNEDFLKIVFWLDLDHNDFCSFPS
jgi:hypothetical protein